MTGTVINERYITAGKGAVWKMEDIIVFGRGRYYKSKKRKLLEKYRIIGFIDNAVKSGEVLLFEGKEVVNPDQISFFPGEIRIVLMSAAFFEMWEQLKKSGVDPQRIKFAVSMQPFYDEIEQIMSDSGKDLSATNDGIVISDQTGSNLFQTKTDFQVYLRNLFSKKDQYINLIAEMPNKPISKRFGRERGTPIDRIYIERFLKENRHKIQGTVMEIASSEYTKSFGHDVEKSLILHVNGWGKEVMKGNLETGEGIIENSVDCLICTQTIQFIYDVHKAVHNIYTLLKPGGTALITAHCLGQISLYDYYNWGEYWRFTDQSMRRIFSEDFGNEAVNVKMWGNMKTAIAYQYGLCAEDLIAEDFEMNSVQFPLLITVVAEK